MARSRDPEVAMPQGEIRSLPGKLAAASNSTSRSIVVLNIGFDIRNRRR